MIKLLISTPLLFFLMLLSATVARSADESPKADKVKSECLPSDAKKQQNAGSLDERQSGKECLEQLPQSKAAKRSQMKEADYGALAGNPAAVNLFN